MLGFSTFLLYLIKNLLITVFLSQQKMKMGPLVARVMKLFLHFHLVFSTGITFSYLVKVKLQQHILGGSIRPLLEEAEIIQW